MADISDMLKDTVKWFVDTFGLENMVVFSFIMSVLYLLSKLLAPPAYRSSGALREYMDGDTGGDNLIDFESLANLAKIADKLNSTGNLTVPGNLIVRGKLDVDGGSNLYGDITTQETISAVKGMYVIDGPIVHRGTIIHK